MNNRDLLKEAIADAKAVKETAIANAKAALEEAFTPYLKERLAAKLSEIDEEEDDDVKEAKETEKEVKENFYMGENDELEEMDLDELLRELEDVEAREKEDVKEGEDDLINDPKGPTAHGNVDEEEEIKMGEEEEEIDLENMSEDDLKTFIEDVIADMVAAGELEGEIEGNEDDDEDDDDEDESDKSDESDESETSEEEISIDELIAELKERKKYGGKKGDIPASKRGDKKDTAEEEGVEDYKKKLKESEFKLNKAYSTIETIKTDLNEVNLLNAKLLYTNKIFRAKNLTESQKVKVLESFDKATNVKEAKLVFETLLSEVKEKNISVTESRIGGASKAAGIAPTKKPILEINDQYARWQHLAGIKK
jgi:hypothetical protein